MVLVERDRELALLTDLLDGCLRGAGGVAVVRGPVAVGKTELVHAFAERASGAGVLSAAGSPAERDLPFGLLGQLLPAADRHRDRIGAGGDEPRVLEDVARTFLDLAAARPLLVVVDDVDHADDASLRCLLFLARRIRRAGIVLVLTEQDPVGFGHSRVRAELARQPYCRQIRLDPLSSDGVAALLAHELDAHVAHSLAPGAFAVTGGNPLLVRALAEDWQSAARSADFTQPYGLVVGDCFAERVVGCLYRRGAEVPAVARAVAVLGDAGRPALVAELAGVDPATVAAVTGLLDDAGILWRGRYRHPAARAAVLADLPAARRAELHRHAARVVHADGGGPTSVARHLIAAGAADEPWASAVLRESADRATAGGQVDFALDCLRLAHDVADDEQQRAVSRAVLAEAEWRLDPARVVRHLGGLATAVQDGRLTGGHADAVLGYLLWHGRADGAALVLDRLAGHAGEPHEARDCLDLCYPAQRAGARSATPPGAPTLITPLLAAARGERVDDAGALWHGFRLGELPLAPVAVALLALAGPERPEPAPWFLPLLDDAAEHGGVVWRGLLAAVRADTALRRGDLPAAAELAATALAEVPAPGWGVVVGAPLACLLTAALEMGRHDDAAACLSAPVPAAMLETPFGLRYLRARGQYQLATDRPYAALSDFQTCGRLLRGWEADGAGAPPWRVDAAQALLRLDRRAEARRLLDDQLARLRDDDGRVRGRVLRQLAAVSEPRGRARLLTAAVGALQAAGDRVELARALADLGAAHTAAGDSRRARPALRRAWQVAGDCHAEGLSRALLPSLADAPPSRTDGRLPRGGAELSTAEYRVGSLAAQGLTNRQIAARLHITVSTVEQHLTQVYRKLDVRSRVDLPVYLQTPTPTPPTDDGDAVHTPTGKAAGSIFPVA